MLLLIYADGTAIGTSTTSNSSWGPIAVNTTVNNTIYPGAVLQIGIAEPSKNEVLCATSVTVSCPTPAAPAISPSVASIQIGETVTYTVSSSQTGILYSLRDNADATNIGNSKFGSGSLISLDSDPFNTEGTYTVKLKAISFSGSNCDNLTTATVMVSAPLPVSLSKFEGKYEKGINKLQWITSSEENLDFFEIQRSYTGNDFRKIATVQAAGNSQVTRHYSFNDSSVTAPVIYYKLKLADKDRINYKYSNVIALHADKEFAVYNISPNPFTDLLNICIDVILDVPLQISLSDVAGRKIKTINYAAKKGSNNISMTGLSTVSKGTYFVEINSGGESVSRQLILKR